MEVMLAFLIVLLGSYVQSSIGFGLAIIAAPTLYLLDPIYVPAPVTFCALVLSLPNAWRHRHEIALGGLSLAVLGRIPGTVAGVALLTWMDPAVLGLWIGITVLVGVAVSLTGVAVQPTGGHMAVAGFMSGFMGTSSSVGGPPMAMVMQHQEAGFIRANLATYFIIGCLMSLATLIPTGHFGVEHLLRTLPLLPATWLGYWLASHSWHLLSRERMRTFSLGLCAIAGIAAIASALL